MAVDRDRVARNALRFIQKGQFHKAIEEYKKVLSGDPRDIRTRLKLINLYSRAGSKKEAVDECLQVTEVYADQGFYLKAIAVYKQALRVDPENPLLSRSMGEMYIKQGLVGDALGAFKRAVDLLRRQGNQGEAEDLLLRMEELAPENAAIKVHLAELYLRDGKYDTFEQELAKLILQLRGEGRSRKLLQIVEGFYERSNHHPSVLIRLAELYVDLGEEKKAVEVISEGLARDSRDRNLRLLALRAHLLLGHVAEGRSIALELHEEDPEDLFILEQIASIARNRGEPTELADAYKAMAKVYERRGLQQKEEECYRRVLELFPEDAEAQISLGGARPVSPPQDIPYAPAADRREPPASDDHAAAGGDPVQEGLVEVDLYLKYGMEEKAAQKLRELTRLSPQNIPIRQKLRDLCQRQGDRQGWIREQLQIADLFLREKRENEALRSYQAILEVDSSNAEAQKGVQYLKPELRPRRPADIEIDLNGSTTEFVQADGEEQAVRRARERPGDDAGANDSEGLAEADFYESQGLSDEAVRVLLRLQAMHPESLEIESRLKRLGWADAGAAAQEVFIDLQKEVLDAAGAGLSGGFASPGDLDVSEFDDIVREFRSGIAQKIDETDYETHYNLGVAYREMELLEDAAEEFRLAARSPDKAREAYTSLGAVFREMGKSKDAQAAFEMALAIPSNTAAQRAAILYEMGLLAEEEGEENRALMCFERAAEESPAERGVQDRIRRLRARVGG
jgi:tetratricopeptide (TPR) repeat protein